MTTTMYFRYLSALFVSFAFFIDCSWEEGQPDIGFSNLAKIVNKIGFQLYPEIAGSENVFFSPLSLSTLFGMLYLGSRGPESQIIAKKLGFEGTNFGGRDIHETFKELAVFLADNSIDIANALFTQKGLDIRESYKRNLDLYYGGKSEEVDFGGKLVETTNYINQWVSQKTRNKIPELFKDSDLSGAILVVLNAIYFKENWASKFNVTDTNPATFTNQNGKKVTVPLMTQKNVFLYGFSSELEAQVVDVLYDRNNTSMLLILPEKNVDLSSVERQLTPELLDRLAGELKKSNVHLSLPRFRLSLEYKEQIIKRALNAVGLGGLISLDYSGISDEGLKLTDIYHKAALEVNEEGTEAAAVSAAVVRALKTVRADRPFLFFIRDKRTGLVMFMGRVNKLSSV
ncbi:intracellular coagulation inhibitor 1-like [Tachypleus tridentatus]|uniref:intracellular coagulation inhibitor 1-like n=1 Tax=Tachypleus tridentatus TaxID=6853 RepID=UPI003FD347E6